MKKLLLTIGLIIVFLPGTQGFSQTKRTPAALGREEYIEVEKNVRLHVTDLGTGQPIVLIQGWPLSDAMYQYQYAFFIEQGYRVIGITLRGYGLSDKPAGKYDYDVFADDIKVVLDKLKIENATLGGFSMGGGIVIHYTAKYNAAHISKLALFGAAAPIWTKRADFNFGFWTKEDVNGLIELNNTNRPQLFDNFGKIFPANETSVSPGLGNWLGAIQGQSSFYATAECLKALRDTDLREDLKKINVPTLILHGKLDKICSYELAEQMHANIKNSTLIPLEKSGHALFIEELTKFNTELLNFIKK
ncbi:Pimeloyl-ACP methyl ester carboxylesterase [Flavobacterium aquidurense]|uniref:Alpha/beta hydrolase n=1 Tax=Flavobacterium frigidimaris TaxID=262320 RepID=A0ABX4BPU1_FLAFR|nr:alpha/beta hydrolase [Flavobacterium frigidimaris]OXA78411.1 alpha/beta hydrolase [Flavobacterium frigidimaris]SDZ63024.1 Pimeloyl-ACP methyl ester carboxylesterase [Flavobacterium aquidurense]